MDIMNEVYTSTLYTGLLDYDTNLQESSTKSLLDLCLEKLVSDVFYVRNLCGRIPLQIHSLLLNKAFDKGRPLSIICLMKQYPEKSFVFPLPIELKNWSEVLLRKSRFFNRQTNPFVHNISSALTAFFDKASKLHTLDMSQVFIPFDLLNKIVPLLEEFCPSVNTSSLSQPTYTLRAGLITTSRKDIKRICDFKRALLKNNYVNLEVTALQAHHLDSKQVNELFQYMQCKEIINFSLELSVIQSKQFILQLQLFSNLQSLSLSYCENFNPNLVTGLAKTLNSFVHLKQLKIRGTNLSNSLQKLLRYDCDQTYTGSRNYNSFMDCCVVHRGKLEYLNFEFCRLKDNDLLALQEFSFSRSLKYLNVGGNPLKVSGLAALIEKIGSSLRVLEITHCVHPNEKLKHLFSTFVNLFQLKLLNMEGLWASVEDVPTLLRVLEKMPELHQIALSKSSVFSKFSSKFEKLKYKQKLQVLWCHESLSYHTQIY